MFEKKRSLFCYTGPTSLKNIEDRLLEIEQERAARKYNMDLTYDESFEREKEIEDWHDPISSDTLVHINQPLAVSS